MICFSVIVKYHDHINTYKKHVYSDLWFQRENPECQGRNDSKGTRQEAERSSTVSKSRERKLEQSEVTNSHSWFPVVLPSARLRHVLRHQHVKEPRAQIRKAVGNSFLLKPPQCIIFSFTSALLVLYSPS